MIRVFCVLGFTRLQEATQLRVIDKKVGSNVLPCLKIQSLIAIARSFDQALWLRISGHFRISISNPATKKLYLAFALNRRNS